MGIFLTRKNILRCPSCGGYFDKRDGNTKCFKCQYPLVTENEYSNMQYLSSSTVKCPYCNSNNTSKISTLGRAVSTAAFGVASGKIGKQWHCNGCGSDF